MTAASGPAYAAILRQCYPRVLARLLARTGSLTEAEDAVQEATLRALAHWPSKGIPQSPSAWLITVATNAHRDRLRKGRWEQPWSPSTDGAELPKAATETNAAAKMGWPDELLRLVFACCHPCLEAGESAALCLATILDLSTSQVAHAFLAEPRTMEQRLTRARRRLREQGDPNGAPPTQCQERIPSVLCVLHLLFNEGYWSSQPNPPIRHELCRLALGLTQALVQLFSSEPEALGLLALLTLHEARRPARLDPAGDPVALPCQDRTRWNTQLLGEGLGLLDHALQLRNPGPLQIEAAIAAVHCRAARAEDTDWPEIADLYALLEQFKPTPTVRVNRAFAVGQAHGANVALALLAQPDVDVARSPYLDLVRGELLGAAGRQHDAQRSLQQAHAHARNDAERAQLLAKLDQPLS